MHLFALIRAAAGAVVAVCSGAHFSRFVFVSAAVCRLFSRLILAGGGGGCGGCCCCSCWRADELIKPVKVSLLPRILDSEKKKFYNFSKNA